MIKLFVTKVRGFAGIRNEETGVLVALDLFAPKETDSVGLGHLMGIGRQAVRQRLVEMDQGGQRKHDILQGMIDAKSESAEKDQASEDEILTEAMIPILAGLDSMATEIRAIVLELARREPVLTRLLQELHETWNKARSRNQYSSPKRLTCVTLTL